MGTELERHRDEIATAICMSLENCAMYLEQSKPLLERIAVALEAHMKSKEGVRDFFVTWTQEELAAGAKEQSLCPQENA
jgi:hypothetical protein